MEIFLKQPALVKTPPHFRSDYAGDEEVLGARIDLNSRLRRFLGGAQPFQRAGRVDAAFNFDSCLQRFVPQKRNVGF